LFGEEGEEVFGVGDRGHHGAVGDFERFEIAAFEEMEATGRVEDLDGVVVVVPGDAAQGGAVGENGGGGAVAVFDACGGFPQGLAQLMDGAFGADIREIGAGMAALAEEHVAGGAFAIAEEQGSSTFGIAGELGGDGGRGEGADEGGDVGDRGRGEEREVRHGGAGDAFADDGGDGLVGEATRSSGE